MRELLGRISGREREKRKNTEDGSILHMYI
jgi:hypothetical protein